MSIPCVTCSCFRLHDCVHHGLDSLCSGTGVCLGIQDGPPIDRTADRGLDRTAADRALDRTAADRALVDRSWPERSWSQEDRQEKQERQGDRQERQERHSDRQERQERQSDRPERQERRAVRELPTEPPTERSDRRKCSNRADRVNNNEGDNRFER